MRLGRVLAGAIALALLGICVVLTFDRIVVPSGLWAVVAMAFVAYALPGYLVCLALALWLRRRARREEPERRGRGRQWSTRVWSSVAVIAFLGAAMHAGWLAPAYVGAHPSQEPTLTVLQLNTRHGDADPAQVAELARSRTADVVVLEEADTEAAARYAQAGLRRLLPHTATSDGAVVFSRWPLRDVRRLPVSDGGVLARVAAPRPFWLLGLHTTQPLTGLTTWHRDLAEVRRVAAGQRGRGIVVGDFNATLDHEPMRQLHAQGLRDAAEAANAGWQPTWPSDQVRIFGVSPPLRLITIDHVLVTRQFGVVSTRTVAVPGTDHEALVASLVS